MIDSLPESSKDWKTMTMTDSKREEGVATEISLVQANLKRFPFVRRVHFEYNIDELKRIDESYVVNPY